MRPSHSIRRTRSVALRPLALPLALTTALALALALASASASAPASTLTPPPAVPPPAASSVPSLSSSARDLIADLHSIHRPGVPGSLVLTHPDSAPLVLAEAGPPGVLTPVIAIGALGHGRVVAFGHSGYFSAESLRHDDTDRLFTRIIHWAAQANDAHTPAAQAHDDHAQPARIGLLGVNLTAHLTTRNFHPVNLDAFTSTNPAAAPNALAEALNTCDAILLASNALSLNDEQAILDWLQSGRGLIVAATGWGFLQLNPTKTIEDLAPHRLSSRAGIAFTNETVSGPSGRPFTIQPDPPAFTNAARALAALVAHERGEPKLADADLRQAASAAMFAARAISPADTAAAAMLDQLTADHPPPEIRPAAPLRASDHLDRIRAAWFSRRWSPEAILTLLNDAPGPNLADPHTAVVPVAPGARFFPGDVELPEGAPLLRHSRTVEYPADRAPANGKPNPGWISTGLYAPPGETILVLCQDNPRGARIRIGAHSDHLYHLDQWRRWPEVSLNFPLRRGLTFIASPYGGLIYADNVPRADNNEPPPRISIANAVEAPRFVLGRTTPEHWRTVERNHPAPWAELEGARVILTLPSEVVRTLDDPEALMRHWDRIADACADLAQRPRHRDKPERIVADVQISAGYMHSGYPIMTHLDAAKVAVDLPRLASTGSWGHYHELGHNHQSDDWTFNGTVEVTVNLFTLYAIETVCGKTIPEIDRFSPADRAARISKFFEKGDGKPDFNIWKNDPFLALEMYIQMRKAFGWDAFKTVFREYRDLARADRPKNDDEKRDQWLVRFSKTVGHNLGPFFQAWGVPTSPAARDSIADLPTWMPPDFPPSATQVTPESP